MGEQLFPVDLGLAKAANDAEEAGTEEPEEN